jgi:hypothetical protein
MATLCRAPPIFRSKTVSAAFSSEKSPIEVVVCEPVHGPGPPPRTKAACSAPLDLRGAAGRTLDPGYTRANIRGVRVREIHGVANSKLAPSRKLAMVGYTALALLSLFVALSSLRFFAVLWHVRPSVDPGVWNVIGRVPVQALGHMIVAPVALLTGPFNFISWIRLRHPKWHRWNGRVYVAVVTIGGLAALATAPFASGVPVAGLGFGILATLWVSTTFGAWRAAVNRNFDLHRRLMRYSFAMTFAAVTLRLQIPLGVIFFHFKGYGPMSVWLAWTSWIPNVLAVALYDLISARQQETPLLQPAE